MISKNISRLENFPQQFSPQEIYSIGKIIQTNITCRILLAKYQYGKEAMSVKRDFLKVANINTQQQTAVFSNVNRKH